MSPLLHEAMQDMRAELKMLRAREAQLERMVLGLSTCAESRRVALETALSEAIQCTREEPGCGCAVCSAWRARIMKLAEGGGL